MRYYPLLVNLTSMRCLVAGTGEVGLRKIQGLLPCAPAMVLAVDPTTPNNELCDLLASHPNFTYAQRPFAENDVNGMDVVFACTPRRVVNAHIGQLCAQRGIWCSIADAPEDGTFVLPASIMQGDLTLCVSTNGASPALSRVIRQDLEQRYGPEYAGFTRLLRQVRADMLALGLSSAENRIVFRELAASTLPQLIRNQERNQCQAMLRAILPAALHPRIGEWCDDCFQTV